MELDYSKSFIEEQFPVSKISKESFKERKAGASQTLTVLGKWWGRKPLVLVRAVTLGCLLPVSNDKKKDKEVFLKLMGMDVDSLFKRKVLSISIKDIFNNLSKINQEKYFEVINGKVKYKKGVSTNEKKDLQKKVFESLSYDDKLAYCCRPENMKEEDIDWNFINNHLSTNVSSISELIEKLSIKRYGHKVVIGDCFSGGGSNVFESARIGCDVYASDLNPIAGLLTWADLNILGCSDDEREHLMEFQDFLFDTVTKEIDKLGIESRENGDIAKYYLYCNEVVCPECGYKVPLLPSFKISDKENIVIKLIENSNKGFDFKLCTNMNKEEFNEHEKQITIQSNSLNCPHCKKKTSIASIRGGDSSTNLRKWNKEDYIPRKDDVFTERLYAIKYITLKDKTKREEFRKKDGPVTDATFGKGYYAIPTEEDLKNEEKVHKFLEKYFLDWQSKGYIPSLIIAGGYNQDQPIRERGWRYWHQLFNERQLLFLGLLNQAIDKFAKTDKEIAIGLLSFNNTINRLSKLSIWNKNAEKGEQVFSNQALNTLYNYACRSSFSIYTVLKINFNNFNIASNKEIFLKDAKDVNKTCDIWITDPPYADAVNYHELSEFFSSWNSMLIKKAFPTWYVDSKRALAIKGAGKEFNENMVEVYKNLANHMPDNGFQVVMFTHQDTKVWAELAMILWSSGLQVSAAWCIATETSTCGLKQGNYVQGTVIMVLHKQKSNETIFKDELYEEIRDEVKLQIDSMRELDKGENQDFSDGDYLLAAYVAALKVLTSYKKISGIDVQYELQKARENKEDSPVTKLIELAKKEAYDYLVPNGITPSLWRDLIPEERFYIKGFELELNGNKKLSSYQEIARGFGVNDYDDMFASKKANQIRLKTPSEYKDYNLEKDKFGKSLLRHILKAIQVSVKNESAIEGRNYLKAEYDENNKYWIIRNKVIEILLYFSQAKDKPNMDSWIYDSEYAFMLSMAIKNDSI